jgi:pilus assembly protein CpaC
MQLVTENFAMFMSKIFARKDNTMKKSFIAASLISLSLFSAAIPPMTMPAVAADGDAGAVEEADNSRFVRMGLNKTVVVRIPGEARDVIVGNPEIVDAVVRSKNTAYLFARKTGQTNIFFFDVNGQQILALDLEVAQDTTALRKLLNRTIPGNRITVDVVGSNVILGGVARNALEMTTAVDLANKFSGGDGNTVINTATVEGADQVMLKVKVVEIQRDVLKQFGVDFSALVDTGKFAFKLASVNPFANSLLSSGNGVKSALASGNTQFEGLVRAMESDGLVRTLAEPNLTAMTGQSAKFHAGGEYPYEVCDRSSSSVASCTVSFKEFGVKVDFTPTVLSEDRIILKIASEVSELSSISSSGVPALNTRKSDTTLELPSGGSMMIAGLIRETTRQNINGTPGLKKLPILGTLFRSRDFVSNETELVVFVTPILVRPTSQSKLTTPDKGFNPTGDKQAIFMGRLNKVYGGNAGEPQGAYHGNVGFIVE